MINQLKCDFLRLTGDRNTFTDLNVYFHYSRTCGFG